MWRRMHNSRHQFCEFFGAQRDARNLLNFFFFLIYMYIFFFLVMWKRCVRARAPLESATAWRADTATATVGGGWCAVVRWFQLDLVVHKDTNDRSCLPFPQTLSFFKNFL